MLASSHSLEDAWARTGGPFFPATGEIGFLQAPCADVVDAFASWRQDLKQRPVRRAIEGGLKEGVAALLPLTTVDRRRWTFFQVGNWTAFLDNGARGTDAMSTGSHLAQAIGCRGLRVVAIGDQASTGAYAATILELYGAANTDFLNYIRSISVANDGGRWRFDANGTPQAFEDLEAYKKRRIQERFTPQMLRAYLAELGVSAFDPSSYRAEALVERTDEEPEGVQHLTLEEARARFTAHR
jgi:hypothetical protein